jgi:hypothetical protein
LGIYATIPKGFGMIKFLTNYYTSIPDKTKRSVFSSYVWADNLKAARALCKKRGLGEKIFTIANKHNSRDTNVPLPGHKHFTHWICFLGFVALKAGYSPEQIFGDAGILHDLVHSEQNAAFYNNPIERYKELCRDLGFLPTIKQRPRFVQLKNPISQKWVKVDTTLGRIVSRRSVPFKNVEKV